MRLFLRDRAGAIHKLERFLEVRARAPEFCDCVVVVGVGAVERGLLLQHIAHPVVAGMKEEGAESDSHAHHGPKPPVPVLVRSLLWLWLLLGLPGAVAAALGFRAWRRRRMAPAETLVAVVEADDLALEQLAALKAAAPWKRGEGRPAIFRLSEIVRTYLGARLQFNALDLTSEEFLSELRHRRLMGIDLRELEEEVRWEDLVKFAKLEPTGEECLLGISRAESMVHHTRPLRALPQTGRAA